MDYTKQIQERTFAVLVDMCDGDMMEAVTAYGRIYPTLWKQLLSPDEMELYGSTIVKNLQES